MRKNCTTRCSVVSRRADMVCLVVGRLEREVFDMDRNDAIRYAVELESELKRMARKAKRLRKALVEKEPMA